MEPLRGGLLANPPVGIRNIFASADVPRLPAEWALRYVWENQEVITALSGMNDENQILVNCAVASTAFPNSMPNSQLEVVKKAQSWFDSRIKVPCTGCKYCVPCPKGVSIPEIFEVYNNASMRGLFEQTDKIPVYQNVDINDKFIEQNSNLFKNKLDMIQEIRISHYYVSCLNPKIKAANHTVV